MNFPSTLNPSLAEGGHVRGDSQATRPEYSDHDRVFEEARNPVGVGLRGEKWGGAGRRRSTLLLLRLFGSGRGIQILLCLAGSLAKTTL